MSHFQQLINRDTSPRAVLITFDCFMAVTDRFCFRKKKNKGQQKKPSAAPAKLKTPKPEKLETPKQKATNPVKLETLKSVKKETPKEKRSTPKYETEKCSAWHLEDLNLKFSMRSQVGSGSGSKLLRI